MNLLGVLGLLGLAVGCSHTPTHTADPHDAVLTAAQKRRDALDAEKPKSPYETRRKVGFKPTGRCGQGPYRVETDAVGTAYAEETIVYACGPHAIAGNYRFTVTEPKQKPQSSESAFGFGSPDNAACKADHPVTVASGGGSGGGGSGVGGGTPGGAGTIKQPASATVEPTRLEHVTEVPSDCRWKTQVMDFTWEGYAGKPPFPIGTHLAVDIWSEELNDLSGLTFVIETRGVVADMTLEKWTAYQAAMKDWNARRNALVDEEVAAGTTHLIDSTVKTPPPPAKRAEIQPPRPSQNARWIPGYWHFAAPEFHWIAGMWDVPQADVEQDLTVHAPAPPPPAPVEHPKEPQPVATATWAQGQWQWDGRAYVWVAGAWRIPPRPDQMWRPAGWRVKIGGAVYVPGGWVRGRRR